MSTNITVQKGCEFRGQKFTAKTLSTRHCSKQCNSRHYKQLAKEEKTKVLNAQLTAKFDSENSTDYSKDWYNEARQQGFVYLVDFAGYGVPST